MEGGFDEKGEVQFALVGSYHGKYNSFLCVRRGRTDLVGNFHP